MSELIAHRGPDGHGLWERERGGVAFGHRRLSIIDLTTGEQPMTDGDGAWVIYNGEIYNYVELREVLGRARLPHDLRHRGACCAPTGSGAWTA